MLKVNSKDVKTCTLALQWYKEKASINQKGQRTIGLSSSFDFIYDMTAEEMLYCGLEFSPNIPEFTKRKIINRALFRWLRYKKYYFNEDILKAFVDAIFVELKKWDGAKEKFSLIALLNIQWDDLFLEDKFNFNNTQIRIITWNDTKNFHLEDIWENVKIKLPKHFKADTVNLKQLEVIFSPVLITTNSYTQVDALYMALESFNLFRATLNYASATSLMVKLGEPFPISKFRSSPVFGILDCDGKLIDSRIVSDEYWFPQPQKLKTNEIEITNFIVDNVVTDVGLWKLVSVVLSLYQQALDLTNDREIFLALWRVLETAILDDPERPVNIRARVSELTGIVNDPLLDNSIKMLTRYRNDLVHKGDFPRHSNNLIFVLKKIVDITIRQIIRLAQKFDDINEYGEYLGLLSINNKDMERKIKALDFIRDIRSQSSA